MRGGKQHHSHGRQWSRTTQQRRRTAAPPKRGEVKGAPHTRREAESGTTQRKGREHHQTKEEATMINPESFRQRVNNHIRGWRSLFLSCEIMHEAHGIVRLHVECWIQPSSRHCVPPRYHWRTRACEQMVHTQHTYNGRLQMIKHTYVDALRRVATILHVCSYVLPSVYMFKVIFPSHLERHIHVEERVFFWKKKERCSSSPFALAVPSWFVVQFSLLCQLRGKVGASDFICTWWQRLSDVTYLHLGRNAEPFVTVIDNIIAELDITLHYRYTLERCLLINCWRWAPSSDFQGRWTITDITNFRHLLFSSHSSWSWLSGLIATTWRPEDLNYAFKTKIRLFFYEFW